MSVTTKVHKIATLGADASSKLASVLDEANRMMKYTMRADLYEQYAQYGGTSGGTSLDQSSLNDTISAIEVGTTTKITLDSTNPRQAGDEVTISGVRDKGLYRLNGRQSILSVEDGSTYNFDIDTEDASAYTSGGLIYEVLLDDLETAEANFAVYQLITAIKDIKEGDIGIIPTSKSWGDGNYNPADIKEINRLRDWFYNNAVQICEYHNSGNTSSLRMFLI